MRVMTRTLSSTEASLAGIAVSLGLNFTQIVFEAVEALAPELAIFLEPVFDGFDALRLDPRRAGLGCPAPRDEARLLQHFQVLRDGRQADVEGFGQLVHTGLSKRKAREDRATRRVGQS